LPRPSVQTLCFLSHTLCPILGPWSKNQGPGQRPDMQCKPEQSVNLNGVNLDLTWGATKIFGISACLRPAVPIWNRKTRQN
jgi:hypothetical protein